MNRRNFLKYLGSGFIATNFAGCSDNSNLEKSVSFGGKSYEYKNGIFRQNGEGDGKIKIGVLADIHAREDNLEYFLNLLEKENVEAYFVAGDLTYSFGDSQGVSDNYDEMTKVMEQFTNLSKPVFVIPGNHEQKKAYSDFMRKFRESYNHVVDMEISPVADLDDLTIVALGGIGNERFCVSEGYLKTKDKFEELEELAKKYSSEKPLMIGTHVPQSYKTKNGLDFLENGTHAFDPVGETLTKIKGVVKPIASVSGHIHEAYGIITQKEELIKDGELVDRLDFNPGAVWDHLKRNYLKPSAGILEFAQGKVKAYRFER